MRSITALFMVIAYCMLITFTSVTSRPHRQVTESQNYHHRYSHNEVQPWRRRVNDDTYNPNHHNRKLTFPEPTQGQRSSEEEESDEGDYERHAYVMSTDHLKPTPVDDEHQTLQEAFQKHMNPEFKVPHDIYAYKLPSDLWFIVRYKKNAQGQTDKYMNVVSSFTKYLDKMDSSTKSVSVNVNGVETVFRLTSKT